MIAFLVNRRNGRHPELISRLSGRATKSHFRDTSLRLQKKTLISSIQIKIACSCIRREVSVFLEKRTIAKKSKNSEKQENFCAKTDLLDSKCIRFRKALENFVRKFYIVILENVRKKNEFSQVSQVAKY